MKTRESKRLFKILSGVPRGSRTLCEFHRGRDGLCTEVTFNPVVSATSYKLSQQQQLETLFFHMEEANLKL